MASITLELEQQAKTSISRAWAIPVGLANLTQGLLMQSEGRYFNIVFGGVLIAAGFYFWILYKPKIVTFDENGIDGKIQRGTVLHLRWEELTQLEVSMHQITLFTKSGQKYTIDLSNITFREHKELKPQILELAKSKQIEVVAA